MFYGTKVSSSESFLLAIFERMSAWEFLRRGIRSNSNLLKVGRNSMTNVKYASMPQSLAMKLPFTWLTTS